MKMFILVLSITVEISEQPAHPTGGKEGLSVCVYVSVSYS